MGIPDHYCEIQWHKLSWSKSVLIYIQGKDKEDYLTGLIEVHPKANPKYQKWKIENAMVMGQSLSSIKPEISDHYRFLDTAHQIWESLSQAYSQIGYATKVYDLQQKIAQLKQGDQPPGIYYASLQKLWEELDQYSSFRPACTKDVSAHKKHVEETIVSISSQFKS